IGTGGIEFNLNNSGTLTFVNNLTVNNDIDFHVGTMTINNNQTLLTTTNINYYGGSFTNFGTISAGNHAYFYSNQPGYGFAIACPGILTAPGGITIDLNNTGNLTFVNNLTVNNDI